jgi:hypothetical protein
MKKLHAVRSAVSAVLLGASAVAHAAGDSGTSSVSDMPVTGAHLAMMAGGVVLLGVVVWVIAKVVNR